MNEKKKQEIPMPFKFDDFFTTQEQRDDAVKEKIEEIDISLIDNFKDHPFKVLDNDDMKSLKESIKTSGILSPVIIREKEDGRYEMVSGHRRKYASQLANKEMLITETLITTELSKVVSLSKSNPEKIQRIRDWGKERALKASK